MPQFAVGLCFLVCFLFSPPALPEQQLRTVLNVTPPSTGQQVQLVRGYVCVCVCVCVCGCGCACVCVCVRAC